MGGCSKYITFPIYVVVGLLGVVAFLEKVSTIPIQEMKLAMQLGKVNGEGWDLLRFLMMAN